MVIFLSTRYGKMVFALLDKIIVVYIKLIFIYVKGFGFKKPFLGSSRWSQTGILDFKIILKIRYRSSLEYLGTKKAVEIGYWLKRLTGKCKVAPINGSKGHSISRAKGFSNSLSPLGVWEVGWENPANEL